MEEYSYTINATKPDIAVIPLGKLVLGGNDALVFTSKLDEISKKSVKHVIVDLSKVELMNSWDLGMLVSGLTTLKKYNIEMALACVPSKVENLLQMTHLNNVFKIYPDIDSATGQIE